MENSNNPLSLNEGNKSDLLIIAKWLKFFAILMLVMAGLMIFASIFMIFMGGTAEGMLGDSGILGKLGLVGVGVIYLLFALLYIYPALKMKDSAKGFKEGILHSDQASLDSGFKNLRQQYKFWGIVTIILLALYALIIVGALIYGGLAASKMGSVNTAPVDMTEIESMNDSFLEVAMEDTSAVAAPSN